MMLAAIRLKGGIEARGDIKDTMLILGMRKKLAMAVLADSPATRGMLGKAQNFIAWGELSGEMEKQIRARMLQLRPPKGGFRSLKQMYPRGDLGYRGEKINDLIKRMM